MKACRHGRRRTLGQLSGRELWVSRSVVHVTERHQYHQESTCIVLVPLFGCTQTVVSRLGSGWSWGVPADQWRQDPHPPDHPSLARCVPSATRPCQHGGELQAGQRATSGDSSVSGCRLSGRRCRSEAMRSCLGCGPQETWCAVVQQGVTLLRQSVDQVGDELTKPPGGFRPCARLRLPARAAFSSRSAAAQAR